MSAEFVDRMAAEIHDALRVGRGTPSFGYEDSALPWGHCSHNYRDNLRAVARLLIDRGVIVDPAASKPGATLSP